MIWYWERTFFSKCNLSDFYYSVFHVCFLCHLLYNNSFPQHQALKTCNTNLVLLFWGFFSAYRIPSTAYGDYFACATSNYWRFAFSTLPWIYPPFSYLLCYSDCFFRWSKAMQLGIHDRKVKNFLTVSVKGTNTSKVTFSAKFCWCAPLDD